MTWAALLVKARGFEFFRRGHQNSFSYGEWERNGGAKWRPPITNGSEVGQPTVLRMRFAIFALYPIS